MQVNTLEAKTEFSKLLRLIETRREDSITVARSGKPIAILTRYPEHEPEKRIGIAKGKFSDPADFESFDNEIAELLLGDNK